MRSDQSASSNMLFTHEIFGLHEPKLVPDCASMCLSAAYQKERCRPMQTLQLHTQSTGYAHASKHQQQEQAAKLNRVTQKLF